MPDRPGSEDRATAERGDWTVAPARDLATAAECLLPPTELVTPKCLVHTNFAELNPEFARHHLEQLYIERRRRIPGVALCRLPPDTALAVPDPEEFLPLVGGAVAAEQVRPSWTGREL